MTQIGTIRLTNITLDAHTNHYGFCDNESWQDTRERVHQCPRSTKTFCHECTDLLRQEIDDLTTCPKCGWNPNQTSPDTPQELP